jgi:hypothetical protein
LLAKGRGSADFLVAWAIAQTRRDRRQQHAQIRCKPAQKQLKLLAGGGKDGIDPFARLSALVSFGFTVPLCFTWMT